MNTKMGEMHTRITPMDLAAEMQVSPERVGQLFRSLRDGKHPHFVGRFNRFAELNPIQVALLRGEDLTVVEVVDLVKPEIKETEGASHQAAEPMSLEAGPVNESAPQKVEVRRWALWAALVVTAGASVPNMVEVTTAIKGSSLVAWALTAVFTVVPGLLIAARLRGFLWFFVVVGVMGYTAFCNATSIFGGLTALDKGYILQPTVFLEAVTNLLNTDYLNTARAIAYFMALALGTIEYIAFKNLAR